jgi:hypothetical protein
MRRPESSRRVRSMNIPVTTSTSMDMGTGINMSTDIGMIPDVDKKGVQTIA